MTAESFIEECHTSIERGHELWKSYFSKWETLAKYEEEVPESELQEPPNRGRKPTDKRKEAARSKVPRCKKNKKGAPRKVVQKKVIPGESENELNIVKQCNNEDLLDDSENKQLEAILKSVFTEILNSNRNKFEIFAVLSQTSSQGDSALFSCHLASADDFRGGARDSLTGKAAIGRQGGLLALSQAKMFNHALAGLGLPPQRGLLTAGGGGECSARAELGVRSPAFWGSNSSLKPALGWDLNHKSPSRVCRKINKEYFIKRRFSEMNIAQDGKRFRSLCLRKRTGSVGLSMENSNFITPERKPSERKCLSETVSQRKRWRPSKVFFDNEAEEDSESDDQTNTRAPLIHCATKMSRALPVGEVGLSDSDDCDAIFDRVITP